MKKFFLLCFMSMYLQHTMAQDGMLYTNFGNNGSVVFSDDFASSALAPDGKIVALLPAPFPQLKDIIRYNVDGTIDATFGANGFVTSSIEASSVRVQSDGKVVAGGTKRISNPAIGGLQVLDFFATERFNVDGTPDLSYGGSYTIFGSTFQGITLYQYDRDRNRYYDLINARPNDRSIIRFERASPSSRAILFLYAEENVAFSMNGTPTPLYQNDYYPTNPLSVLSFTNGSYIVGGNESGVFEPPPSPGAPLPFTTRLLLNKYTSPGNLDPSFGSNGIVALPGFGGITNLTIQNDNKIVGTWQDSVIRFNPDGSLDVSFGDNGVATVEFITTTLLLQPNGKLIIGGTLNGDFAITRLNTSGTIDATFGNDGLTISDFGENEYVRELTIINDTLFAYGKNEFGTSGSFESNGRLAAYTLNSTCTPPTFLNTLPIVGNATCGNNDGQISIIPQSGTAPYMYSLDGGATYESGPNAGFTQFNLAAGTYQLRLKDANGCESEIVTRTITTIGCPECTPPTFLNTLPIVGDASCNANDGQISIIPTSGTRPFMYSIDGGATYVSGPNAGYTFFNLAPGNYQLRLKDMNGCESAIVNRTVVARYGVPTLLNTLPIIGNATCGQSDGQIVLIPTSGTGPFMYSIDGGTTYTAGPDAGTTIFNLPAGTYQLRIKSGSGCESEVFTRTIENINCPSPAPTVAGVNKGFVFDENIASSKMAISAYPNPSRGQFVLKTTQSIPGKGELSIFDSKGILVQKSNINIGKSNNLQVDLTGEAPGIYYLRVERNNSIQTIKLLLQ